ncbi:MAG TPA: hypothetical protein PKB01_02690 [Xanthobacteraceae bacterium]|nr:hypothetical protein [Xanthobacteraceae bacterium]
MKRAFVAALAFAALAAASVSASAQEVVNVFGFRFEDSLGTLKRINVTDFEKTRPGFGYGVRYAAAGHRADIFVYDRGRKEISADIRSEEQRQEFTIAGREIQLARQSGIYSEGKEGERFEYPAAKAPFFSCQRFTITRKDGGQEDSVLCLGARNNKFVKIRIAFSPPSASSVAVAEGLLAQIARMTNF